MSTVNVVECRSRIVGRGDTPGQAIANCHEEKFRFFIPDKGITHKKPLVKPVDDYVLEPDDFFAVATVTGWVESS